MQGAGVKDEIKQLVLLSTEMFLGERDIRLTKLISSSFFPSHRESTDEIFSILQIHKQTMLKMLDSPF